MKKKKIRIKGELWGLIKRSNILSNYFISFLTFSLKPLHFYIRHADKHRYDCYKSDSYWYKHNEDVVFISQYKIF